jgi:cell division protein ZapA
MATINVEVNGRTYAVGCEDGQEEHVRSLARQFRQAGPRRGRAGGRRRRTAPFLLAALTTADELAETRARLDRLQTGAAGAGILRATPSPDAARLEQRAAAALEEAARRVEALADQVA